ncbi:phage antirepressor KilAC domain-containing protein [Salipiger thiooxidans]|uniref:phage antirepressor n=1 Tax=Salipiger thiooxidans TaxID=282683 RepID=UPI001A8D652A|nr:phage antirepressor KilAC domain-containing protein [Salipiger thiooxidans]MBN8189548.1 phage antirepressor KilAC domain-containing protein [Salipiger thiooxidans]
MGMIVPFNFDGAPIRVLEISGDPWFVGKDVAGALGYSNPRKAVRDHCRKAQDVGEERNVPPSDLDPQTKIIPEGDVYRLIVRSKLPSAERFEALVMDEILPTIRKTGAYGSPQQLDYSDPAVVLGVIGHLKEEAEAAKAKVIEMTPKAKGYDELMNADGLYGLQNAARALSARPNLFIRWLKQTYLFYQGSALVARVQYTQRGLFEVRTQIVDDKARPTTFITPKGLDYFRGKLPPEVLIGGAA